MKRVKKYLFPFLTVIWLLFIFSNSLDNAGTSGAKSGRVVKVVVAVIERLFGCHADTQYLTVIVRKLAHFSEFAVFALLLGFSFYAIRRTLENKAFPVLFCGLFAAVTDEFLQTFSDGRAPMVTDVLIDFAGVMTGFGAAYLVVYFLKRRGRDEPSTADL